jgi:hypothetical protein
MKPLDSAAFPGVHGSEVSDLLIRGSFAKYLRDFL